MNTDILVGYGMHVIAKSDWVIDIGPDEGDDGGMIDDEGKPATYLAKHIT